MARKFVREEAKGGIFAQPENEDAIAEAIIQFASDPSGSVEMDLRGRHRVESNASRESRAARYLKVMEALALDPA